MNKPYDKCKDQELLNESRFTCFMCNVIPYLFFISFLVFVIFIIFGDTIFINQGEWR